MTKLVVTITPPTPNGDLHIGHIAGPFMAADVFTRVQRQRGHKCVLISYSDDYQSYMLRRGLELQRDPSELAKSNTAKIRETLACADIQMDHWMEPNKNPYFEAAVREVFEAAADAGAIEFKDSPEPYCGSCQRWGYEAFGRGHCNYCGADSDASQCENCAHAPEAREMQNFRCKLCGQPHQWKTVNRAFLKLEKFKDTLRTLYQRTPFRKPLDSWVFKALSSNLNDWGVTRPGDAGLDLEPDGSCRIHTWFMGLPGYMATLREYSATVSRTPKLLYDEFLASGDGRLVHFLGFDCAFSHAVVYPALLSTMPHYDVQQTFYPNQFLTLNGLNMSTSRNHALWMRDLVAEACSDSARLYLASVAPEEDEGNFDLTVFRSWRQEVFVDLVDALMRAASVQTDHWTSGLNSDERAVIQNLRRRWLAATTLDQFSMRRLAQIVLDTIALTRERLSGGRPVSHLVALWAAIGRPIHPNLSSRIFAAYRIDEEEVTRFLIGNTVAEYSI